MDSACMLSVSDLEIPRRLVWVFSFWSGYDQKESTHTKQWNHYIYPNCQSSI